MDLPAGRGVFVRAVGWRRLVGARLGLLRGRLLRDPGAPPPQIAARCVAGCASDGLRARYERDDIVLDVLLQRPGPAGTDTGRVRVASGEFCSRSR